ncbi:MAG: NAD(P)-binding domain-containing protein, partial [Actinobacteria bacterium]|nr:NAD(P)-binding domain-containing protein [Actinomycetota bacterium]
MRTTTVIIGAGHAGLAMSRRLTDRSIDHVVLERGEVANSWRTERWPSLRLLTPNWQTRLPGRGYAGDDPGGFASMPEVAGFIEEYARASDAPVRTHTAVTALRSAGRDYEVTTTDGVWRCPTVVVASGACNRPVIPALAEA